MSEINSFDFHKLMRQLFELGSSGKIESNKYTIQCLNKIRDQISKGQTEWLLKEIDKNFPGNQEDSEIQNWLLFKKFLDCLPEKTFRSLISEIEKADKKILSQDSKKNILFQLKKSEHENI